MVTGKHRDFSRLGAAQWLCAVVMGSSGGREGWGPASQVCTVKQCRSKGLAAALHDDWHCHIFDGDRVLRGRRSSMLLLRLRSLTLACEDGKALGSAWQHAWHQPCDSVQNCRDRGATSAVDSLGEQRHHLLAVKEQNLLLQISSSEGY